MGASGSTELNSGYKLRERLIFATQFFCFGGPCLIVVFQLLTCRPAIARLIPQAIRPISEEENASRVNVLASTLAEGHLHPVLRSFDRHDFSIFNGLLTTSPATLGIEPLQGKRRILITPASILRSTIQNNYSCPADST